MPLLPGVSALRAAHAHAAPVGDQQPHLNSNSDIAWQNAAAAEQRTICWPAVAPCFGNNARLAGGGSRTLSA